MKKRVAFIEAKARGNLAYASFVSKWPLMGCVTMATILHQRGHSVTVYNENLTGSVLDDDAVFSDLLEADFVGLTALTPAMARAYEIAERLRKAGMKGRLAIGGCHATFMPDEALSHVPCVVRGEAENVIVSLVEDKDPPEGIVTAPPVDDLDSLPTADLGLIHRHEELWRPSLWKEFYEVPLVTSRGCPYGCTYCSVTQMFGRRCRTRSVEKVLKDIMLYYDRGYRSFFFYDDNFMADHARTKCLLKKIAPLKVRWDAQCRIDCPWIDPASRSKVDRELMAVIKDSGVNVMYIGYETVDDKTAREWHKGYGGREPLMRRLEEDTRILHEHGVWIHGMFVMGPQHGVDTYDTTLDFAHRNAIDSIQMSILTPFPGTRIMDEMKEELIFTDFPHDWQYFDGAHLTFHHRGAGNKVMQEAIVAYHRKYYQGLIHQRDRLRHLLWSSGGFYKKFIRAAHNALRVRRMFRDWEAETDAFIEETARRGEHYLYPAVRQPIAAGEPRRRMP